MGEKGTESGRRVIFLDRDGTLNEEVHYLHRPEDLKLLPGAAAAVRCFNEAGYEVVVVTNQAGVARGYYTEADVERLHLYMNEMLAREGAHVDAFYYCPHHPEYGIGEYKRACHCRKPDTGMFEDAEKRYKDGIDKLASYMIGDKLLDTEAGRRYGVKSILVGTGYGAGIRKKQEEEAAVREAKKVWEAGAMREEEAVREAQAAERDDISPDFGYDFYAKDLLKAAHLILEPKRQKWISRK